MHRPLLPLIAFASLLSAQAVAQTSGPLTFDFKDPKEISAVSLKVDSLLEPIVGYAKGLSGTLLFDPAKPLATKGKIAVSVSSILFANEGYTATARGYALNETKYPELTLEIKKVLSCKKIDANTYKGTVLADFVCRGVSKQKKLEVTASYLPGRAEERTNGNYKGDLLILRTKFKVSRKEHGISEGIPDDLVGDQVEVGVAVVGIHYWPKAVAK
ncbi:MAG: YceI family protein [Fimbriimonas sp.]